MPSGLFLSLDGIDGTGKSTQVQRLVARLQSLRIPVTACADPGGTELGAKLRELLLFGRQHTISTRAEAMLFMASRAELVEQIIRPALTRGEVVVSDRFSLSNVVYQGHAGGLPPDEVREACRIATGGLEPDLTLVLDLPLELAASRRKLTADRLESRGADYYQRVRNGFLHEAKQRLKSHYIIDASADVDTVHEAVWRILTSARPELQHTS